MRFSSALTLAFILVLCLSAWSTAEAQVQAPDSTEAVTTSADSLSNRGRLRVIVTGFDSDEGKARLAIFNSEETFTSSAFQGNIAEIKNGEAEWIIEALPAGRYAVVAHHDENENARMDTRIFGLPKEAYAFSNDARGRFGPPAWSEASFETKAGRSKLVTFRVQ